MMIEYLFDYNFQHYSISVQYREVPKYSVRRRDSVASAAMFALSRSRSDPRINLIMAEGRYISPSNSTQSFSHLDNISSPSRDYSTDSPRSMSISSTSSGPGMICKYS